MELHPDRNRRLTYAFASFGVVGLGILWRSHLLAALPLFLRKYGGDALWAALVFCLVRFCCPSGRIVTAAAVAFGVSVAVELSQLYHAPWIDSLRSFRLGHFILGSTFNAPDIAAYAAGILLAALVDRCFDSPRRPR